MNKAILRGGPADGWVERSPEGAKRIIVGTFRQPDDGSPKLAYVNSGVVEDGLLVYTFEGTV